MSQNSPSLLDLIRTTLSSRKHLRFYILRMFVDKDEIILIKRRKGRQGEEEEASVHSATGTKDHRLGNILTHTHTHTHTEGFSHSSGGSDVQVQGTSMVMLWSRPSSG